MSGLTQNRMIDTAVFSDEPVQIIVDDRRKDLLSTRTMGARRLPNPLAGFAALEAHRPEGWWISELGLHSPLFVCAE